MKVVVLGNGPMLLNLIAGLKDCDCDIVGVMRAEKSSSLKSFFKDIINPSKEYTYIKSSKIKELKSVKANSESFKKEILKLNADIILVGSWGEKLKKEIIDLPKIGTINVHPALLPKYRGPNPYLQVILHGEKESGVTFHLMDENYDTGAILSQYKVPVYEKDTGKELRERIANKAREGVCELISALDSDIIIPIEQNNSLATYYENISRDDLMLDFSNSAEDVSRRIRALHPWCKTYISHNTHFLVPNPYCLEIVEYSENENYKIGEIVDVNLKSRSISVYCGDGKVLKMSDIKLYGILRAITRLYMRLRVKIGKVI